MNIKLLDSEMEMPEILLRLFRGQIPMLMMGNEILDDKYETFSIGLDPFWPFGITEQEDIMNYKIETGVEVPRWGKVLSEEVAAAKKAIDSMEINQSFLIPKIDKSNCASIRAKIMPQLKFAKPKAFITRLMPDGLRVWRIQ